MYSIIVTAAIFIAMIFNDVLQKRTNLASFHAFLGAIATGLMIILWYLNYEMVGWGLIILPITALLISYIVVVTGKGVVAAVTTAATTAPTAGPVLPNSPATPAPACVPSNLAGPYTAIAPPPPSTVSLPAVPPTPSTPAMSTNTPTPIATITPITAC